MQWTPRELVGEPRIGSLFAGIGGLERGLELVGAGRTVWQCEREVFCRSVLAKHWPDAQRFDDVRELDPPPCDIMCGGLPCQGASVAGKRAGLAHRGTGLWAEFRRCISIALPGIVFFENVRGFLTVSDGHAMGRVLSDLAGLRYDACWGVFSAAEVGAPHRRERLFLLAYADLDDVREQQERVSRGREFLARGASPPRDSSNPDVFPRSWSRVGRTWWRDDAREPGVPGPADSDCKRRQQSDRRGAQERHRLGHRAWDYKFAPEPVLQGVADGLPAGMAGAWRSATGKAVVPQQSGHAYRELLAIATKRGL